MLVMRDKVGGFGFGKEGVEGARELEEAEEVEEVSFHNHLSTRVKLDKGARGQQENLALHPPYPDPNALSLQS